MAGILVVCLISCPFISIKLLQISMIKEYSKKCKQEEVFEIINWIEYVGTHSLPQRLDRQIYLHAMFGIPTLYVGIQLILCVNPLDWRSYLCGTKKLNASIILYKCDKDIKLL